MQIGFSPDQLQFRDVVERFLADKSPPSEVRRLMDSEQGYEPAVWAQLCGELGLTGTHIPEEYGGFGFGAVELGIISQEMGRYLFCGPFFASAVMAGYAILNAGTEAEKQSLLPPLVSGETIATLVLDDLSDPARVGGAIRASGARLSGRAAIVIDAAVANLLVVAAGEADGVSLFLVEPDAKGVAIEPVTAMDPTRKLARVRFDDVPAERVGAPGGAKLDVLWDQMSVALAHEMIGGAERLFNSTIEYMKVRVQFGRPIGSFQALKHRVADLLLDLELAKAMTHGAAHALESGEGDPWAPNMAKAMASDAYMNCAKQAIQLRGGIGFTWEEDTHLWFKRAKSSEVLLGTPAWHRERMMQRLEAADV